MAMHALMPEPKVFYVAKDGDDTLPKAGTQVDNAVSTPFLTIGRALEYIVEKGDNDTSAYIVKVGPGVYAETLDLTAADGLNDSVYQVRIEGAGKELTVIGDETGGLLAAADSSNLSFLQLKDVSVIGDISLEGANGNTGFLSDGFILTNVGSAATSNALTVGAGAKFIVDGDSDLANYDISVYNVGTTNIESIGMFNCKTLDVKHDMDDGAVLAIPDSQTAVVANIIGTVIVPGTSISMTEGTTTPDITFNIYNGSILADITITANATLNNYSGAISGTVTATGTHNIYGGYPAS